MKMTKEIDKFIRLLKERPEIYNYKLREHSNHQLITKLWIEIATEMKISASECRNKYFCLRNSLARSIRARQNPYKKRRKVWYLEEDLSFLEQFMKPRSHDKKDSEGNSSSEEKCEESQSDSEQTNQTETLGKPTTSSTHRKTFSITPESKQSSSFINNNKSSGKKRISSGCDDITGNNEEDPDLVFFKIILKDYKKISSRRQRVFKESVLSTLHKLLDEEETETNSMITVKNQM